MLMNSIICICCGIYAKIKKKATGHIWKGLKLWQLKLAPSKSAGVKNNKRKLSDGPIYTEFGDNLNTPCVSFSILVMNPFYIQMYFIFSFLALVSSRSAALNSATQHAMPPESGRKWGTDCLNTSFLMPTLLCVGYSVKLIFFLWIWCTRGLNNN